MGPPPKNLDPVRCPVDPPGRPGPVTGTSPGLFFGLHQVSKSVTMGVSDEEDDCNSESGEDDGEGQRCDDEVEEVIQSTSVSGDSVKYILLLPERNEDKENKAGHDLKTPKESVEQRMGGRISCGTTRS